MSLPANVAIVVSRPGQPVQIFDRWFIHPHKLDEFAGALAAGGDEARRVGSFPEVAGPNAVEVTEEDEDAPEPVSEFQIPLLEPEPVPEQEVEVFIGVRGDGFGYEVAQWTLAVPDSVVLTEMLTEAAGYYLEPDEPEAAVALED